MAENVTCLGCWYGLGRYSFFQSALNGTTLRGQIEPKRRSSQIFADSCRFLESKAFAKRRFSQKTANFLRKPQKTAGTRRRPQIGVRPLWFVPSSAAPKFGTLLVFQAHLLALKVVGCRRRKRVQMSANERRRAQRTPLCTNQNHYRVRKKGSFGNGVFSEKPIF